MSFYLSKFKNQGSELQPLQLTGGRQEAETFEFRECISREQAALRMALEESTNLTGMEAVAASRQDRSWSTNPSLEEMWAQGQSVLIRNNIVLT